MERLGTLPFVAQPGEAWVYGYNTDILGCVVEKASGHAARRVHPDAHHRSARDEGHAVLPAAGAARPAGRRLRERRRRQDRARARTAPRGQGHYVDGPRKSFAGGAGLLSTARDYARFLEMIRNGGALDGVRILSPRTVALMTTNQVGTLHSPNGLGFGLGFETTDRYGANGLDSRRRVRVGAARTARRTASIRRRGSCMVLMIQLLEPTDIRQSSRRWSIRR